jgi:hypothetical protein
MTTIGIPLQINVDDSSCLYRQTYNFLIKVHSFCTLRSVNSPKAGAHPLLPKTHYQNSYSHHFDPWLYRLRSPSVPLLLPYLTFLCSPPLRSRSYLPVVANAAEDNQQPAILKALLHSPKKSLLSILSSSKKSLPS